ncbi:MAG: glycosyltransferase [Candidatus Hermodarchaeota archaeon]
MKKVLFLLDSMKTGGGTERILSLLTNGIANKYELSIVTIYDFEDRHLFKGKYYSFRENIKVSTKFLSLLRIHNFIVFFKIYKAIKSISPDLIISVMDYMNILTVFMKSLFHIKIPLLISIWCNPIIEYKSKPIYVLLIKILYRIKTICRIITVSKELNNLLERDYHIKKEKFQTIYTGIEVQKIKKLKNETIVEDSEIFLNDKIIKFITVGRLVDAKGHKHLIEAFFKVKNELQNSVLIIRGNGPLKKDILKLIEKRGLENEIFFLGVKKNIFKYIARADIFVLSSEREGFPTVLLEALACGVPIISTDCDTGPKEILDNGKYGLLAKNKDSQDLAQKMIKLAKDKDLQKKYSELSLKRAEFFDIKYSIDQWIDLINSSIKDN